MAKKKTPESNDIAADFFGDDVDWLDEEEEAGGALPIAPAAPPKQAGTSASGESSVPSLDDAWANRITQAPLDPKHVASAPTLTFSSVPTLPPGPSPLADLGSVDRSDTGEEDAPTVSDDTAEVAAAVASAVAVAEGGPPPLGPIAPSQAIMTPPPAGPRTSSSRPKKSKAEPAPAPAPVEAFVDDLSEEVGIQGPAFARVTPAPAYSRTSPPPAASRQAEPGLLVAERPTPARVTPPPVDTRAATPATATIVPDFDTASPAVEVAEPANAEAPVVESLPEVPAAEASVAVPSAGGPPPIPDALAALAVEPAPLAVPAREAETTEEVTSATEEVYGDELEHTGEAQTPLVRTVDPSPQRDVAPTSTAWKASAAAAEEVAFTPPTPAPRPQLEKWTPSSEDQAWRDAASAMIAEAALGSSDDRGQLLFEAAEIYAIRLGDAAGAEALQRDAHVAGCREPRLLDSLARLSREAGQHAEALGYLDARSSLASGAARADREVRAALYARDRVKSLDGATERARRAVTADPEGYAALTLLRDLVAERGETVEDRADVLGRLAAASDGLVAAEAWVEQAKLLRDQGRLELARGALDRALAACPWHSDAFAAAVSVLGELQDHVGLAALYEAEAQRDDQPEAGWWLLAAARARAASGDGQGATALFRAAGQAGFAVAYRELEASFLRAGDHAALADALLADLGDDVLERAWVQFWVGSIREHQLQDAEGALEAYRAVLETNPSAAPAAGGAIRVIRSLGRVGELLPFLEQRIASLPESPARRPLLLQVARLSEDAGDYERATRTWRALRDDPEARVSADPGSAAYAALAHDGLVRSLERQGRWDDLAGLYADRAASAGTPAEKARWLHAAATVGEVGPDAGRSARFHRAVLELVPDHVDSLQAFERLAGSESSSDVARALARAAAVAAEPARQVALYHRAAERYAQLGMAREAREAAEHCLDRAPEFEPAFKVLVETAEGAGRAEVYRRRADRAANPAERAWYALAASMHATDDAGRAAHLDAAVEAAPNSAGLRRIAEVLCTARRNWARLVEIVDRQLVGRPSAAQARMSTRQAELLAELGRRDEAVHVLDDIVAQGVEGRPLRAAARIACGLGAWEQAVALLQPLGSAEDRIERARLLSRKLRQGKPALELLESVQAERPQDVSVAILATRAAFQVDDRDAMVRAQGLVAQHARSASMRAAYAAWTAGMLEGFGREDEALAFWRIALAARPGSEDAFEGVERGLVAGGNGTAIRELFASARPEDARGLARALEAADDSAGSVEALRKHVASVSGAAKLAGLLQLERGLSRIEDWQGVYDTLVGRREISKDENQISSLDAKRRWLLASKLAETDAAWELYRALNEEDPQDREVTEALARIAGARGETALAIQYLGALAAGATDPGTAARYQRRIGDVYERNSDRASARQAYLDALDHVPDDGEALAGLKRLAEVEQDWAGLIAVLQREAVVAPIPRRLELRREIARITDEKLKDPAVALDALRGVLELAPQDTDALGRMLDLAEGLKDWGVFVDTGKLLAALRTGSARSTLLRRVGVVCLEQLDRDDAIRYFEQAVSGDHPDFDAARRLEDLYRSRNDWNGTLRALGVQVDASPAEAERVAALLRAARIETDVRHDREAASRFYSRVLQLQPHHEGALRFLATHLYDAGRYDEALPVCERLEPFVEKGQDLDDFDTRMELSGFYFTFAEMLRQAAQGDKAMPRYERALALNPTHLASLEAVGPIYIEHKQWKKAEKIYRELLQLSGGQGDRHKVATMYAQLGIVERALGSLDKASKRFNKALEMFPNHVGALKGMALVLEDQEEWNNLLNVYNNIIYHATVPADVIDAYMTKGRILDDRMARPDKAAQHYQRSLDFDQEQPLAFLRLAELAMRRDAYQEAGELAQRALGITTSAADELRPLVLLCAAAAAADAGKQDDAQKRVGDARALAKDWGEALSATPTSDLESLRRFIKERIPNTLG